MFSTLQNFFLMHLVVFEDIHNYITWILFKTFIHEVVPIINCKT